MARRNVVQVGDADEPRPARCDHRSCGGRSSAWMSVRARAPSISAPAAADEASQARAMSPASVASRRICAALPASWTALTSSACAGASSSGGAIADASFRIRAAVRWMAAERGGRRTRTAP